jgi:hypothetical protein
MLTPKFLGVITLKYKQTLPLKDHEVVLTFDDGPLSPYTENCRLAPEHGPVRCARKQREVERCVAPARFRCESNDESWFTSHGGNPTQ